MSVYTQLIERNTISAVEALITISDENLNSEKTLTEALQLACEQHKIEIVKIILTNPKTDPNLVDIGRYSNLDILIELASHSKITSQTLHKMLEIVWANLN